MDLSALYMQLLGGLQPFFEIPPNADSARLNARDNASGAVARMIVKNTAAVPLDQVCTILTIQAWTIAQPLSHGR